MPSHKAELESMQSHKCRSPLNHAEVVAEPDCLLLAERPSVPQLLRSYLPQDSLSAVGLVCGRACLWDL